MASQSSQPAVTQSQQTQHPPHPGMCPPGMQMGQGYPGYPGMPMYGNPMMQMDPYGMMANPMMMGQPMMGQHMGMPMGPPMGGQMSAPMGMQMGGPMGAPMMGGPMMGGPMMGGPMGMPMDPYGGMFGNAEIMMINPDGTIQTLNPQGQMGPHGTHGPHGPHGPHCPPPGKSGTPRPKGKAP